MEPEKEPLLSQTRNQPVQRVNPAAGGPPSAPPSNPADPNKRDIRMSGAFLDGEIRSEHEFHAHIDHELDGGVRLEEILVRPNVDTLDSLVNYVNQGRSPAANTSVIGRLIEPGKFGILSNNGKIELLPPGRYLMPNPRVSLLDVIPVTSNPVRVETLSIVRVQRGQFGLARENGVPVLLDEGLHARNSRLFEFLNFQDVNQTYLRHGSIHIIRVPKGHYAKVTENSIPKLLPEGMHCVNSTVFSYEGIEGANTEHIWHGTIHIVRVSKGRVAKVVDNNIPFLLHEGTHRFNSATFNFAGMEDLAQQVIRHGTITRFRVRKGEIGLCWDENQPEFFEEGVYEKNSPNFVFERCVPASTKEIVLGAKKIITVYDGEVGVSYDNGKLRVLQPDRHLITSQSHTFSGFLSTQQQCLSLAHNRPAANNRNANAKIDASELLVCETKDFVEIGIRADVFFKIVDAEKVLLIIGKDKLEDLVRETSIATLNSIIRSTSLSEVAQNKEFAAKSEREHMENVSKNPDAPSAPLFFDKVHDEFISKLHDQFRDMYGVDIRNIRIESFKIMNQELSDSISKQAFTTAATQTQLSNMAGQTEIVTAQQERDANLARIKAEGDAVRLRTEVDAKNRATLDTARAEADATLIRAEAQAKALEMQAKAEANAIRLKAAAESEKAEKLSSTPLAKELAIFELQAQLFKSSLANVQKIMYLPTEAAANPLSFFSQAFMQQQQQERK